MRSFLDRSPQLL